MKPFSDNGGWDNFWNSKRSGSSGMNNNANKESHQDSQKLQAYNNHMTHNTIEESKYTSKEPQSDEHDNIVNRRLPKNNNDDRRTSLIDSDRSLKSIEKKEDIVTKAQTDTDCNIDPEVVVRRDDSQSHECILGQGKVITEVCDAVYVFEKKSTRIFAT